MFYSQFILAKKGPLGTIWIAAHLERKLRKNQVADTDIGVSVDSILFPEVPIALRLSSHLLLGVVRIYSRKVNYLFNDCSETLVKIKQAFHSTVVDLPPEASTAPYHSITLPETFDLDDLELPESSFSHGNFVDHHVTTREQITLQDPVEDTIYLGSQFGLDERFGDGDAPQIGLDFDEDLFADQLCSPGPSSAATHLEEDVLPSVLGAEGRILNKREIEGQKSSIPAADSSHLDEEKTRDHSTMQPLVDHSGQMDVDIPNALPQPVVEVARVSSKEIHTPDLNKEIFPCSTLQGPSTPRLTDETLIAEAEEVPISSSLQKIQLFNMAKGIPVVTSQTFAPASCLVSGLSTGLEQVEKSLSSQDCRPALTILQFEEKRESHKIPNKEQVQPDENCLKEQLFAQNESIRKETPQRHTMFQIHEDVNLFPRPNPVKPVMMQTSKEMPAVASNSQSTASPICSLAMPTVPSPRVHYELNVTKQQPPIQEIQASTSSMQLANTLCKAHDVSTLALQQLNEVGDGKKQLHLASGSQGLVQISQMHNNQMLHTPVQQNPIAMQTFSTSLSGQQYNPASRLQSAVGTSGTQQLAIHDPPASATVVPHMKEVSPIEFQQKNNVTESKQQPQFSAGTQEYSRMTNMQSSTMNAYVHQHSIAMHTFPTYVSGQQFNLASGCHSTVGMSGTQEFPSHGFPAPTTAISNAQNVPTMENSQHLYQMAGSQQQLCLDAATQECAELTQRENVGVNTTAQEFNQPMRVFPVSGEHLNKSFGHQSADSMLDTQQIPTLGNTSGPAHVASQKFWSPQRFHVPETSIEVSNVATIEGPWLRACNEEAKRHQSISSIHEAQHGGSNTGESAALFPSSDMQRIPTSFPVQNTYPQSTSFSIPTGVQGASKGMLDGSIAAQSISLIHGTQPDGSKTGESAATFTSSDMQRIPTNVPVQNMYPQSASFSVLTGAQGVSKGIVDGSIAAQSISSIHGAQHGGSKTRESTAIFPSSDMQRIPTCVPVQNTYPQSASFSMPTGVQGASKGIQDGSIAAQSISSIHGVQHGGSKTGESAAIFTSSDMQRIPTNVPVENTYPQSASFSIPTGVQGVSKGILDGSLAAKSISSIHGAQHGGSKTGESAAIFPSSDMQRTPTNVPIQHVYSQSASFFIPTGVQGVSKGVLDESIAGQSISLIHGAQYGGSKIGESAAIFPSSDMQRIPTDVPIQNVYPQSTSFSIATGMQGVSKGMLDRSIAAQHRNFPLEKETWQSHADVLSGNIFQGTSFALQAPTLGTCADVPSRNILQPCSFPTHAETNGVYSNAPSESMLLQDNYFPKVTESDGFLSNVTASKKSAPATFQHQAFSNASDELSNALSINQAQDVTASKGKPFETMQPHLETIRRSEPEIHAHETLRSSYNVGRNEPDIFGLKQPMTANETPREADKNTLTSKQSVGSRKRHMMDTTPVVKESIPKSRSRLSLSNRSLDYIPHDDDVLASILGRTPSFKIKPTPVETVTAKRRRSTPRTTGRKRKALIDIAMVIHGDVIRQQLANTEDIRRVRKKAPCTPQEIRMIQKESQAHYIFFEPSIPGICMELQDLYGQVFGLTEGKLPQVGKNENFTETQKEREPISSLEPTNDSRMVQLEQAERPLEIVSEMESGGQHVGNVHVNGVHMDCFDGSRVHIDDGRGKQDQGKPLDTVSEILPTSLRMNNAHDKQQPEKSVEMGFAVESRRVHMDDFHKEQEQERLQMSVIEVESGRVRAYDDWQNQEQQPQTIGCEVESSQVHTGDVRQKIERPWMVVSDIELGRVLPSIELSRVFTVAVHQKEDQERSQGMASEIESGRVHTLDVHQKQEREQERPRGIVLEIESSRVHAYDVQGKQSSIEAFPKTPINVVIGSEVSNVNKALESSMVQQSHSLSEIESSRVHTLDVHWNQEREQERPQQILSEIESIREHAYDVQGRQASIKALPENSINVITDSEVSNVKKTLESSMVQQGHALLEIESSRVHTLDVHRNQEREQEMPQQILLEMESGRVHAYDIQKKLASIEALPENHINVITGSDISNVRKTVESSMVQQGHASLEIESSRVHRPQEIVLEIESNRVHAYGVQGKQASIEALPENPINAIAGSEISNVKQTLESTVVQQGHAFTNQVFVPQGITFKDCQVQGLQASSALEGGCHNIREIYMSSHQFPLKSSCFSANQEMPLEINRGSHVLAEKHGVVAQDTEVSQCLAEKHGPAVRDLEVSQFLTEEHGVTVQDMEVSQCLAEKHGVDVQDMEVSQCVAGNYRANEGEKIISEDLEVAVMKKDGSNCLVENNGIHVVHTKEGTNMESISEVIKIDDERELRNKEQNIAQDRREQSREIAVIGTIEETVKDCESQRQTLCYSALISVQGKDSVPNNNVHTGDLRNLNTTINTSVQNSGAENTMQDEQVLVYEKSTKMSSNEAEAHGDVALRDREGQDGLNQIDQTVTDDEEFEFLGDADDTEFLEGDGNAQDEFDGKTKAPGTEEDRIQENSGWSARTRAVSRYLKTAFEGMDYDSKKPEAENRQKLSLDHLLMGKRRKEAARMFFETLVLKTRDYVNVEQKDSFDDISIYPRAKLMNTIF